MTNRDIDDTSASRQRDGGTAWRERLGGVALALAALALPAIAAAQQAFTRGAIELHAGPAPDYPLVATLAPGQPLDVLGCTDGYVWCDVVLPDGLRGWLDGQGLDSVYQQRRVPFYGYAAAIGVPIVAFGLGSYWSSHYRDRPWYGDRRWWGNAGPPPRGDWRPRYEGGGGPGHGFVSGPGRGSGYGHGEGRGPGGHGGGGGFGGGHGGGGHGHGR